MKRITDLIFFLSLAIFSSSHVLAADSEDDKLELRSFEFDEDSLNKAIERCDRSEEEIIKLISRMARVFYSSYGAKELQEFYDKNVAEAQRKNFSLYAMHNVKLATLAALFDTCLNFDKDFDHGVLVQGNNWTVLVKLYFDVDDGIGDDK